MKYRVSQTSNWSSFILGLVLVQVTVEISLAGQWRWRRQVVVKVSGGHYIPSLEETSLPTQVKLKRCVYIDSNIVVQDMTLNAKMPTLFPTNELMVSK